MMEYSVYTACPRKEAKRLGRPDHESTLMQRIVRLLRQVLPNAKPPLSIRKQETREHEA